MNRFRILNGKPVTTMMNAWQSACKDCLERFIDMTEIATHTGFAVLSRLTTEMTVGQLLLPQAMRSLVAQQARAILALNK